MENIIIGNKVFSQLGENLYSHNGELFINYAGLSMSPAKKVCGGYVSSKYILSNNGDIIGLTDYISNFDIDRVESIYVKNKNNFIITFRDDKNLVVLNNKVITSMIREDHRRSGFCFSDSWNKESEKTCVIVVGYTTGPQEIFLSSDRKIKADEYHQLANGSLIAKIGGQWKMIDRGEITDL